MKNHRHFNRQLKPLTAILLIVSFILTASVKANEECYILTQKSQSLGDLYLYLCQDAIKVFIPKRNYGMISRAPNWQIVLFNTSTKKYFITNMEKFKGNFAGKLVAFKGDADTSKNWIARKSSVICGLAAREYCLENINTKSNITNYRGVRRNVANLKDINYWVCEKINISDKISQMLTKFYGLPDIKFLPLKLDYVSTNNETTNVLTTYRINKYLAPLNYFNIPNGFLAVASESEVLLDNESQQMINDLAKDLGNSDPTVIDSLTKKVR